jgi:CheY-like chemotaxis protein
MDKKEIFKSFIEKNDVMIIDKNASSRSRLLKIMVDLGCKRHMIHTAGSITEATEIINTKKIGVVLSDYSIGGGSGFDLFKLIREREPDNKQLTLILVTSNISQTAVAKAAEEDVDSFIIKPYTVESIQNNLVSTIANKVQPSEYILKIEEGKQLINNGEYLEAIEVLKKAIPLHSKPALALFYIGQAEYLNSQADEAQGSYNKGLNFNNIHYKCLIGLYEIFMRDGKLHEAYQVVKKVAKYFPANSDRLTQVIRLAIQTEHFEDMQFYYEIFTSLEERSSLMINYIGAGMYISGKHSLLNKNTETAFQYFDNVAVSCSEFSKFIRAIVTVLIENEKTDQAEKYLSRFTPEDRDGEDYLISDYLVDSVRIQEQTILVKKGLELYNRKIRDFDCMKIMVEAMTKCEYKEDRIMQFKIEMLDLWPDKALILSA